MEKYNKNKLVEKIYLSKFKSLIFDKYGKEIKEFFNIVENFNPQNDYHKNEPIFKLKIKYEEDIDMLEYFFRTMLGYNATTKGDAVVSTNEEQKTLNVVYSLYLYID